MNNLEKHAVSRYQALMQARNDLLRRAGNLGVNAGTTAAKAKSDRAQHKLYVNPHTGMRHGKWYTHGDLKEGKDKAYEKELATKWKTKSSSVSVPQLVAMRDEYTKIAGLARVVRKGAQRFVRAGARVDRVAQRLGRATGRGLRRMSGGRLGGRDLRRKNVRRLYGYGAAGSVYGGAGAASR